MLRRVRARSSRVGHTAGPADGPQRWHVPCITLQARVSSRGRGGGSLRLFLILATWCLLLAASAATAQPLCTTNADCADGNTCNGTELCKGGICRPGAPVPDGQGCNTGNPCTNNDVCRSRRLRRGRHPPRRLRLQRRQRVQRPRDLPAGRVHAGHASRERRPRAATTSPATASTPARRASASGARCRAEGSAVQRRLRLQRPRDLSLRRLHRRGSAPPDGTSCSDGKPCNGVETCAARHLSQRHRHRTATTATRAPTTPATTRVGGCKHTARPDGASCSDTQPVQRQGDVPERTVQPGTGCRPPELCEDDNICNGVEFCQDQKCMPGTPLPNGIVLRRQQRLRRTRALPGRRLHRRHPLECDGHQSVHGRAAATRRAGCRYTLLPDGSAVRRRHTVCNGVRTCQARRRAPRASRRPAARSPAIRSPAAWWTARITGRKLLAARTPRAATASTSRSRPGSRSPRARRRSAGTAADPVLHGGAVRVRSVTGGFDQRLRSAQAELGVPAATPARTGASATAAAAVAAAIRSVVVKDGKLAKIVGGAPDLPTSLAHRSGSGRRQPRARQPALLHGFGGATRFESDAPLRGARTPRCRVRARRE